MIIVIKNGKVSEVINDRPKCGGPVHVLDFDVVPGDDVDYYLMKDVDVCFSDDCDEKIRKIVEENRIG